MADDYTIPRGNTQGRLVSGDAGGSPTNVGGKEVLDKYTRLKTTVFAPYYKEMAEDERFYRLNFASDLIPDEWRDSGFEATVPPTAYNAIEAAVDHILTTPEIYVPPMPVVMDKIAADEVAEAKTLFLNYWWKQVSIDHAPLERGVKKLIKDGRMVIKKQIRWDMLDSENDYFGYTGLPWTAEVLPGDTVLEDPDNPDDPRYVFETYQIRVERAKQLYPDAKGDWTRLNDTDKVRFLEYWSKPEGTNQGKHCVFIDNEPVFEKPNPYRREMGTDSKGRVLYEGYVPYFICDTGWGDGDAGAAPHLRYVGMLRYMRSILKTEARQLTAVDAQLRITTFPPIKAWGIARDDDHPMRVRPGFMLHMPSKDTQDIEAMVWPQMDPSTWQLLGRLHSFANELSKSEQLGGGAQRGVDTATEADMNVRNAAAKLRRPIESMGRMVARINRSILWDIEWMFEDVVSVAGASEAGPGVATIGPDEIMGMYQTFVEFRTTNHAALDAADMRRWADMYNQFPIDATYAMSKAGIAQPNERLRRRLAEDALRDPMAHQERVMAMLGPGMRDVALMQLLNERGGGSGPPPTQPDGNALSPAMSPQNPFIQAGQQRAIDERPDLGFS